MELKKVKYLDLELPKKDYCIILVKIGTEEIGKQLGENDQLYFSVKKYASDTECFIQKSIGNGITYNEDKHKYEIEITSEDTENMEMESEYDYDIKIYYEGTKPSQKILGKFKITKAVTQISVVVRGDDNG